MKLKIYKCNNCKKKFIIIDEYAVHCIHCSSVNITIETNTTRYSLYDNKSQMLVE